MQNFQEFLHTILLWKADKLRLAYLGSRGVLNLEPCHWDPGKEIHLTSNCSGVGLIYSLGFSYKTKPFGNREERYPCKSVHVCVCVAQQQVLRVIKCCNCRNNTSLHCNNTSLHRQFLNSFNAIPCCSFNFIWNLVNKLSHRTACSAILWMHTTTKYLQHLFLYLFLPCSFNCPLAQICQLSYNFCRILEIERDYKQ